MFFTMISGASAETWDCDVDGHHYIETVLREGTCTQAEIVKKVCEYCGDIEYENNGFKHSLEDSIAEATCTDPERIGLVCTVCGATSGEMVPVEGSEPLGHAWVLDEAAVDEEGELIYKAATCTEDGNGQFKCSRCGIVEVQTIPATGHEPGDEEILPADCTHNERVVVKCTVCGEVIEEIGVPDGEVATGHDYEPKTVDATCEEEGYTANVCTICGETEEGSKVVLPIDPEAHKPVTVKVIRAATCTTSGIARMKCELCDKDLGYKTITVEHAWSAEMVNSEDTCV